MVKSRFEILYLADLVIMWEHFDAVGKQDNVISLLQNLDSEKEKELERQARIEASLREREREVQKARSEQTKEIDREREQHKREEAIQNFKALLSDMVLTALPLCVLKSAGC